MLHVFHSRQVKPNIMMLLTSKCTITMCMHNHAYITATTYIYIYPIDPKGLKKTSDPTTLVSLQKLFFALCFGIAKKTSVIKISGGKKKPRFDVLVGTSASHIFHLR